MKSVLPFLFTVSLLYGVANSITVDFYSNAGCTTKVSTSTYTLNTCKDDSQGGFTMSFKPTVCNATHASLNIYTNTATCSGSPSSIITDLVNSCVSDQSGGYVKIACTDPASPTIKSSASGLIISMGAFVLASLLLIV